MKKIHFVTIAVTCFLLMGTLRAQWVQIGYMIANTTDTMANAYGGILGFGSEIYAATDSGIFRSADNGMIWTNITQGFSLTSKEKMNSIYAAYDGSLYAGSDRRLFKSVNGGASWSLLNNLADSLKFHSLTEINGKLLAAFSDGTAAGGVYHSTDGGTTWTQSSGLPNLPMFYFLNDSPDVFLGGTNGVYKSADNGQSFSLSGSGFPGSCSPRTVVKSGNNLFAADVTGNGLYKSTDDGATWANTDTSAFNGFCQVFSVVAAQGTVVATMDGACNSSDPVKSSSDGGTSWSDFTAGLTAGTFTSLGRNSAGTSFYIKGGSGQKELFRYDIPIGREEEWKVLKNLGISPNPTSGKVSINLAGSESGNYEVVLTEITGKEIIRMKSAQATFEMDLGSYGSGIYILRMISDGMLIAAGRLALN